MIKTNKSIPFSDVAKHLFCVECKKRVPGCSPIILEFGDTWNEGKKITAKISCEIKAETEKKTRKAAGNGKASRK